MLSFVDYTNQITTIYSAATEFLKATQYKDRFAAAIDLMNQVDIDLHSQAELFSIFDKAFFKIISKDFVDYLAKNLKLSSKELFSHAWFRALSMIPEFMKELENHNEDIPITNPEFSTIKNNLICLHYLKKIAHTHGLIKTKVLISNQNCDLTLSYPGALSEETNKHGYEFAKSFIFKHTPNFIDKEQFLLDRQNNNNSAIYQIYPYTVSQSFLAYKLHSETEEFLPIEVLHLSSVVLCCSNQYGYLLAVGDRGGSSSYSGIIIYKIRNTDQVEQFKTVMSRALEKSINIANFSLALNALNLELLEMIPCMEQLRGYCGFQSAGELNEFSLSLFCVMHNCKSKKGNHFNLDDALSAGKDFALWYHMLQTKDFRKKVLTNALFTINNCSKVINFDNDFYEDLNIVLTRYELIIPDNVLEFTEVNRCSNFPMLYQNYLNKERYKKPYLNQENNYLDHELLQINRAKERLFFMYKNLSNDFNPDLLVEMKKLDNRLFACSIIGFTNAENHYYHKEMTKIELDHNKNPFLKMHNKGKRAKKII